MGIASQNLRKLQINSQQLKNAMKSEKYNANSIADAINKRHHGANINAHDIYNLTNRSRNTLQQKNIEKLELIADVLPGWSVDDFLIGKTPTQDTLQEKITFTDGYNGHLYRSAAEIAELVFKEFKIEATSELVHEYASDTHDMAIKEELSDPKLWEIYIKGAVKSAIKVGAITPKK